MRVKDPEDDTVMKKLGVEALYSAVNILMHTISTEHEDTEKDVAHQMIQIAKQWTINRWSELKLANGKPLVQILKEKAHLIDLDWTQQEQAKLMTLVE